MLPNGCFEIGFCAISTFLISRLNNISIRIGISFFQATKDLAIRDLPLKNLFLFLFQILKLLNSNTENPYLIWENVTRAELLDFLEKQEENKNRMVRFLCFVYRFFD